MKELVVISGKGGTGKTSITASLAALAGSVLVADCDVDAADLHLLLQPAVQRRENFSGGWEAKIEQEKCTSCGLCVDRCRFRAIRTSPRRVPTVSNFSCEGCGVCAMVCPAGAIEMQRRTSGEWYVSDTRVGPMVHARLGVAEENSGKLVACVRREASRLAVERGIRWVIVDGPPGLGCPVIASIGGADMVLIVTEPTVSGLHDMARVLELAKHFKVQSAVCINKCDINAGAAELIRQRVEAEGREVIAELPYDVSAVKALMIGKAVVEQGPSPLAAGIRQLWTKIQGILEPPNGE